MLSHHSGLASEDLGWGVPCCLGNPFPFCKGSLISFPTAQILRFLPGVRGMVWAWVWIEEGGPVYLVGAIA